MKVAISFRAFRSITGLLYMVKAIGHFSISLSVLEIAGRARMGSASAPAIDEEVEARLLLASRWIEGCGFKLVVAASMNDVRPHR